MGVQFPRARSGPFKGWPIVLISRWGTQGSKQMAEPPKNQDELNALLASNPQIVPVNAPLLYASSLQLTATPTGFTLTFAQPRPVNIGAGNQPLSAAILEPVVVLQMSPGTVKDISVLLTAQMAMYEATWGKLETEFTRKQAAEEAAAKAAKAK